MQNSTPREEIQFNFNAAQVADVEDHSVETLCDQLDEMGWNTLVERKPDYGLRIDLKPKSEHPKPLEDVIERIHGTLLRQRPQDQTLRCVPADPQ